MMRRNKFIPGIIVANEKHGDRYFDGATVETATLAYLKLLKERLKDGYYDPGNAPDEVFLDEASIAALPEHLRLSQTRWRKRCLRAIEDYQHDASYLKSVTMLLKSDDRLHEKYAQARELIEMRSDYEYENVRIEQFEPVV